MLCNERMRKVPLQLLGGHSAGACFTSCTRPAVIIFSSGSCCAYFQHTCTACKCITLGFMSPMKVRLSPYFSRELWQVPQALCQYHGRVHVIPYPPCDIEKLLQFLQCLATQGCPLTAYSCLASPSRSTAPDWWELIQGNVTQCVALSLQLKLQTSAPSVLCPAQSILTAL